MHTYFPDEKVNEIRSSVDIVDVISEYVELKPSGRNFKSISPFNPRERTASFVVSPEKQIFKCFSTGKGGNVFTFVMEMENIGFVECLKFVAKRSGIELPTSSEKKKSTKGTAEYDILSWAGKHFIENLNSIEGKNAVDYLKSRSVQTDTIKKFGLGYAMKSWDSLLRAAKENGISKESLEKLGLVTQSKKKDNYYDIYRARIIYPILSNAGKIVGFAGRLLESNLDSPKYINSSESNIYKKSKILYALNFARDSIRRSNAAILVEGYMDTITLHQAGITNVVASGGTVITPYQASLVGRYSKNITLLYDADKAGQKAMDRGINTFLSQGIVPQAISLPKNHDPDTYLRKYGKDTFLKFIDAHKKNFVDFKIDHLRKYANDNSLESETSMVRDVIKSIAMIPDNLIQEASLNVLGEKVRISYTTLLKELRSIYPKHKKTKEQQAIQFNTSGKKKVDSNSQLIIEETFIKSLIESLYHGTSPLEFVKANHTELTFKTGAIKKAYEFLLSRYNTIQSSIKNKNRPLDIADEISKMDDSDSRNAIATLLVEHSHSPRWTPETPTEYKTRCTKAFLDSTRALIASKYDNAIRELLPLFESDRNSIKKLIAHKKKLEEKKEALDRLKLFDQESLH